MTDFQTFGLPAALNDSLVRMKYTTATPIQAQAIPAAIQGRDILGTAQTGTGKTAAFCIPMITHLMNDPKNSAIVMTPTRELATQVLSVARDLIGQGSGIRTALLIGGDSMQKQFRQLDNRPRLIIGTPGRINDHSRRNRHMLSDTNFIVLDEADRMLDMGFTVQIDEVMQYLPEKHQTLMFSATMPNKIAEFSKRYMNDPVRVSVESERPTADNIDHQVIQATADQKYNLLTNELDTREGSVIIFVKTKRGADRMATRLQKDSYSAEAIHGDLKQSRRDRVIRDFRSKNHRILVATDVAARGLDVPHVEHVINYDLPQVAEDYVHRIGRTARAGAKGSALCFVMSSDREMWGMIDRIMNGKVGTDSGAGPSRKSSGYQQSRKRKPHRKGGRDFQRSDRSEGRRDFKRPERQDGDRPFKRSENSEGRRDFKRDDGKKDFRRSDRSEGKRDFQRSERPERAEGERNFKRFEGKRDFKRSDRQDGDRPFKRPERQDGDRPFKRSENSEGRRDFKRADGKRDFRRSDRSEGNRDFQRSERPERAEGERSFKRFEGKRDFKRSDRQDGDRPFKRPERQDGERPFKRSENSEGRHDFKRTDGKRDFRRSDRSEGKRDFDRPSNRVDGDKPFKRSDRPDGNRDFQRREKPEGRDRFNKSEGQSFRHKRHDKKKRFDKKVA